MLISFLSPTFHTYLHQQFTILTSKQREETLAFSQRKTQRREELSCSHIPTEDQDYHLQKSQWIHSVGKLLLSSLSWVSAL